MHNKSLGQLRHEFEEEIPLILLRYMATADSLDHAKYRISETEGAISVRFSISRNCDFGTGGENFEHITLSTNSSEEDVERVYSLLDDLRLSQAS